MKKKMKKCKSCGAEIAKTASRCPNCGARQHQVALSICAIIIVLTVVACMAILIPAMNGDGLTGQGTNQPEENNTVGIEGVLSADCFDLSIVDAKWTTALETSLGTVTPDDAEKGLLCIIFSAKNTTDSVQNVASSGFNAYADGQKVIPKVVVGGIDDAVVFVGAVSPGMEIVGHVVWELPLDWEKFQTSYIDAGTAVDSKQHFVIHKEDLK